MATRKPRKKPAAKRSNSNISAAQRAATQRRVEAARKTAEKGEEAGKQAKLAAARAATDPRRPQQPTLQQNERPSKASPEKVAGLISGIQQSPGEAAKKRALANPGLYGTSDRKITQRLSDMKNAADATRRKRLVEKGAAVFLGTKDTQVRKAVTGDGEFEGGQYRVPETVKTDDIRNKDELMSWLADEKMFNEIKAKANAAGIAVEDYDDVAKLWKSVLDQASATYSTTGKKVTPWALLQLRGKTMKNGKPSSKTTTSTSIDEMDPAEAKLMVKNSVAQLLGRNATSEEIEDFIAKAQTIAKANPNITTTTTQFGFDGEAESQTSFSKGGGDAVTAQAQLAAEEQAKQSEDYASYQAAGVMMPWLNEAVASPF